MNTKPAGSGPMSNGTQMIAGECGPIGGDGAFNRLTDALYEAATGESSWVNACNLLADYFNLWFVQIVAIDKRTGTMRFSFDGGHTPPGAWLSYFTKYHVHNPRLAPAARLNDGEWFHDNEQFDETVFETNPFYRDFLVPHGGKYCSIKKISEDLEQVVMLGVHFQNHRPPLTKTELEAIDRICADIKRATDIYCRLQRSGEETFLAGAVLDTLTQPVVLIDPTRFIHYTNKAANRLIQDSLAITDTNGHLELRASGGADPLGYALRQLGILGLPNSDAVYDSVIFRAGGGRYGIPTMVVAIGVNPNATSGVFGQNLRAILMLHPLLPDTDLDPLLAEHAFGLTPAEADIAVRIANGQRAQSIALARATSVQTIRSQIRAIYGKLGANSHVEVALRLHEMPKTGGTDSSRRLIMN